MSARYHNKYWKAAHDVFHRYPNGVLALDSVYEMVRKQPFDIDALTAAAAAMIHDKVGTSLNTLPFHDVWICQYAIERDLLDLKVFDATPSAALVVHADVTLKPRRFYEHALCMHFTMLEATLQGLDTHTPPRTVLTRTSLVRAALAP